MPAAEGGRSKPGFLGSDRWLKLILQAQVAGLVDYTRFDFFDRLSYLREALLLRELEDNHYKELFGLRFQQYAAASSLWDAEGKQHQAYKKLTDEHYIKLGKLTMPWLDWDKGTSRTIDKDKAGEMKTRWEAVFGKMDSPEVARKIKEFQDAAKAADDRIVRPEQPMPKGVTWIYR